MDREEKVLQEYIQYVQHKEKFVDRTFATNRFYLILILVLLCVTVPTKMIPFSFGITFTMIFSIIGMVVCVLWGMNIASYKKLLKIKFQNVIERLEDELPVKPYQMESQALKEASKKNCCMFGDMQKMLAVIFFLAFAVNFVNELFLYSMYGKF